MYCNPVIAWIFIKNKLSQSLSFSRLRDSITIGSLCGLTA